MEEVLGHWAWQCPQVLGLLPWIPKEAVTCLMTHGHGCQRATSKNQAGGRIEAQYPILMEVTGGTPCWDPFGLIPICDHKSHLSKRAGPVVVQKRDLSSTCQRSRGFPALPAQWQRAVLVAVSFQTPSPAPPWDPRSQEAIWLPALCTAGQGNCFSVSA